MSIRAKATNIALQRLEELRDNSERPYDFRDVENIVLDELDSILSDDDTRRDVLRELVAAACRDADRKMLRASAEAIEARVGQLDLVFPYDATQLLALGDRDRIAFGKARADDLERNLRVETENLIAQQSSYAEKYRVRTALRDELLTRDPRTTVDDVVRPAEEKNAA